MEVSIDVGIVASKKVDSRNRRRGRYVTVVGNGEDCVVVGGSASSIRVFKVFRVRKMKESSWVTSVSNLANRRTRAALISAQYEPNKCVYLASHAYLVPTLCYNRTLDGRGLAIVHHSLSNDK